MSKLFVGNLPFATTEATLNQLFSQFGTVQSINMITDRYTNRPRGFAFVEMDSDTAAQNAISNLNGYELEGRQIVVTLARPQKSFEKRRSTGKTGKRSFRSRSW
ncbi:MAG: RNA-binding protein [candidate division WOR-3 bacterium]|nr:RNA-binding protein [candidate division WOR-3 bacterium]MCX7757596.1 RNA-binding protein [candidate division WOR-3 bacterium]MDW7988314.1 RNA-binding protein [candidate division WOR-3 bacterium]